MKNNAALAFALTTVAACVLAAFSGCTTVATERTDSAYAANASKVDVVKAQAEIGMTTKTATSVIDKPYYGSKSVPFKARSVPPTKFREKFGFHYPLQNLNFKQAVDSISAISGIPIRISQDVNLPALSTVKLNAVASTEEILDQITRPQNLHWEIRDGVAVIQRFVTRSLNLMVQPGSSSFNLGAEKSGTSDAASNAAGGSGSISTGLSTKAQVGKEASMTPMKSTLEAISKVLTKPDGSVVGSEATGSIIVTDTLDAVELATKIVERENEILTRAATFHVEVISFRANDVDQTSMDWQGVFSNLNKIGATLTSPKTLTNALGGSIGIQTLKGNGGTGRFDGTKAFVTLLNEVGKTTTLYKNDIRTRNRTMTTVSSVAQTVYIAKTTPAPAGVNGAVGGIPGIEPGTVTAGVDLKMQPMIFDSNQISLLFSLGVVDLRDIVSLSSGEGTNKLTIEGPSTSGFEFQEETPLTPGVTTLISGYERTLESYSRRKLGADAPLIAGGSFKGEKQSEQIFILITPTIVGSVY